MSDEEFSYEDALDEVVARDPRYTRDAYLFVQRALHHYRAVRGQEASMHHITGPQLLEGVKDLALSEFGPMARTVLNSWGLLRGEDVGETVYNLIDAGLMSKTQEDQKQDFAGIITFDETLDTEASW